MGFGHAAEAFSCYWIGQVVIKQFERFLWLVEKCSQWSLPSADEVVEKDTQFFRPQLTRPLPWVFFLPMLLLIRIWKETISFSAFICGGETYTSAHMVKNIQNLRRTLRAIKYHGIRHRRSQNQLLAGASVDHEDTHQNSIAKWFNNTFFKTTQNESQDHKDSDTNEQKEEESKQVENSVTFTRKKLLVSKDEMKDEDTSKGEDDQWEDEEAGNEDNFNPDAALRELAHKIQELASDTEDSDYSAGSEEINTSEGSSGNDDIQEDTETAGIDIKIPPNDYKKEEILETVIKIGQLIDVDIEIESENTENCYLEENNKEEIKKKCKKSKIPSKSNTIPKKLTEKKNCQNKQNNTYEILVDLNGKHEIDKGEKFNNDNETIPSKYNNNIVNNQSTKANENTKKASLLDLQNDQSSLPPLKPELKHFTQPTVQAGFDFGNSKFFTGDLHFPSNNIETENASTCFLETKSHLFIEEKNDNTNTHLMSKGNDPFVFSATQKSARERVRVKSRIKKKISENSSKMRISKKGDFCVIYACVPYSFISYSASFLLLTSFVYICYYIKCTFYI